MRLFLAVDLDEPTKRRMAARMAQLRQLLIMTNRDLAYVATWVKADKLHVTLHFLGEVPREQLTTLRAALAPPMPVRPFNIMFGDPGVFPQGRQPRVIWLGLAEGRDGIDALYAEVGRRLAAVGLPIEERPFSAHLTLARLKWPAHVDIGALLETVVSEPSPPVLVDHVTLYRSEPSPTGSTYGSVLRIPLE